MKPSFPGPERRRKACVRCGHGRETTPGSTEHGRQGLRGDATPGRNARTKAARKPRKARPPQETRSAPGSAWRPLAARPLRLPPASGGNNRDRSHILRPRSACRRGRDPGSGASHLNRRWKPAPRNKPRLLPQKFPARCSACFLSKRRSRPRIAPRCQSPARAAFTPLGSSAGLLPTFIFTQRMPCAAQPPSCSASVPWNTR